MIWLVLYLTGYLVALGYQMSEAENEYRPVELIACPILWPICLPIQILLFVPKFLNRA
jgi:hypothetical protein